MILSVSSRTDIPAFYSDWFINRLNAGYFDVKNPIFPKNISRIMLEDIDMILFITKDPRPIIPRLSEITIPYIFHITITSYHQDIEPNVLEKSQILESIKIISKIIGKDKVFVRYDPILINDKYTVSYHIKAFKKICSSLKGYTKTIIISIIDDYKNVRNNMEYLNLLDITSFDLKDIGTNFFSIAKENDMTVQTCSEKERLNEYGFIIQDCITNEMTKNFINRSNYKRWSSRNNQYCNCVQLVDIGAYNSCKHLCKYCYANYSEKDVIHNYNLHIPTSSLLIGMLSKDDEVKIRKK